MTSDCTMDINTTLDKYFYLINNEEKTNAFIGYDEHYIFTKNKFTTLVDESENIKPEDIKNYEKLFNNLLPLLKPYMNMKIYLIPLLIKKIERITKLHSEKTKKYLQKLSL